MELNLDFYKEDNIINEHIEEVLNVIKDCSTIHYEEELKAKEISTSIYNDISDIRQNIIDWYEFKNNESVLEIGTEYGILTDFLCNRFDKVVSLDWYKNRAEQVAKKLNDKKNLEIIVGKLNDIEFNEKFDYITVFVDYFEYKSFFGNDLIQVLEYLKKILKPKGKIMLALDNKFGIKYFVGAFDNSISNIGDTIQKSYSDLVPFMSKDMIERILRELSLEYRFYYPLPDYHLPSVIFSDDYLPKKNDSKLMYQLNYIEESVAVFNENKILKQLSNSGEFKFFANSFLIEIGTDEFKKSAEDIVYISYNNSRKEKYRTITKIKRNVVKKVQKNNETAHLINISNNSLKLQKLGFEVLDKYNSNTNEIISKFYDGELFSSIVIDKIKTENLEDVFDFLNKWYIILKEKLEVNRDPEDIIRSNILVDLKIDFEENKDDFLKLNVTKNGLIDLIFENMFYANDNVVVFDQEWCFYNVPIEYIIYRSLNNIYIYGDLEKYIPIRELFDKFKITQYQELFNKIEKKLQEYILCEKRCANLSKVLQRKFTLEEIKYKLNDNYRLLERAERVENELSETIECVKSLREQNECIKSELIEANKKLEKIYNSKLWKIFQIAKKMKGK